MDNYYLNRQKEEIATIKKRQLIPELSDADVERLCEKTAGVGLTPEKLIESFIGNLVSGTYSNGSDERRYADQWFERCWFSIFSEKTFLRYLIEEGTLDAVLDGIETIEQYEAEIKCTKESIESGNIEGRNDSYTWKNIVDLLGNQCYQSRDEWEEEERQSLAYYEEEVDVCWKEINEEWESFQKWTDNKTGTLEDEIRKLREWKEHCRVLQEYEEREATERMQDRQSQEERPECSFKGVKKVR